VSKSVERSAARLHARRHTTAALPHHHSAPSSILLIATPGERPILQDSGSVMVDPGSMTYTLTTPLLLRQRQRPHLQCVHQPWPCDPGPFPAFEEADRCLFINRM